MIAAAASGLVLLQQLYNIYFIQHFINEDQEADRFLIRTRINIVRNLTAIKIGQGLLKGKANSYSNCLQKWKLE